MHLFDAAAYELCGECGRGGRTRRVRTLSDRWTEHTGRRSLPPQVRAGSCYDPEDDDDEGHMTDGQ